jgi:apolipoprotein N-acyltransferase
MLAFDLCVMSLSETPSISAARARTRVSGLGAPLSAAASSGIFLAAPFLHPSFFPLAWVALVPLLWLAERADTLRRAFLFAWLAGATAHLLGFYWIEYTARVFGGFPHGLSEIVLLGFSFLAALPIALFGLLARFSGLGPLWIFPAFIWLAIEFLWPQIFPWYLANSQSQFLTLIQSADLVGLYGVSFLLVWFNSLAYAFFSRRPMRAGLAGGAAVLGALLIGNLIYGHFRLNTVTAEMRAARTVDIAAIQGSIDIQRKWNVAFLEANLQSFLDLTAKTAKATLYLWPESSVEGWIPEAMDRLPPEIVPALPPQSSLIFGARTFSGRPDSPDMKAYNSALLIDADGRVHGRYHKQVLLAFGEYIPFAPILSKVPGMPPIGEGFSRGVGPATLDLPGGIKVAPLICYEDLMPGLARKFVREKGAHLLVNLTNDAWFGNTVAPWQHARLAQWRAIETRKSLVRVTNTGVTTIINPKGEMRETLPLFAPTVLTAKVEIMEGETLYMRYGDWFAWMAVAGAILIVLGRWKRGRPER